MLRFTCLIAFIFLPSLVGGQELIRLRCLDSTSNDSGQNGFATIVLDNVAGESSSQSCDVFSLSFGLAAPPGMTFVTATTDGTDLGELIESSTPLQQSLTVEPTKLTFVCFLNPYEAVLSEGWAQSVLQVALAVESSSGFAQSPPCLEFRSDLGSPTVPLHVGGPFGTVIPHTRSDALDFGFGSMTPERVVAATAEEWTAIPWPDEEPGAPESSPQGGQGGVAALGAGGAGEVAYTCEDPIGKGDPTLVSVHDALVTLTPDPGAVNEFDSLQGAVDYGATLPGAGVSIMVEAGTYSGETTIDTSATGKAYTIYSESGPDVTFLEGLGSDAVVSISGPLEVLLGWIENAGDPESAWHGFTITGGASPTGGGVRITDAGVVVVKGNVIVDNGQVNATVGRGGGIYVSDSGTSSFPVIVEQNRIESNLADVQGAGIYSVDTCLYVAHNVIRDNRFWSEDIDALAEGGGIAVWGGDDSQTSDVSICFNEIDANDARVGGGIWILSGANETVVQGAGVVDEHVPVVAGPADHTDSGFVNAHIEGNLIRENVAWVPAASGASGRQYAGGGIAVLFDIDPELTTEVDGMLEVFNNILFQNSIQRDSLDAAGQLGGGLYLLGVEDFSGDSVLDVMGNHFVANAAYVGGGIWSLVTDADEPPDCDEVTLVRWWNNSLGGNTVEGYAVVTPLIYSHALFFEVDSAYDGRNNMVKDNPELDNPSEYQWFVGCPAHPCVEILTPFITYWGYSVLEDQFGDQVPPCFELCCSVPGAGESVNLYESFSFEDSNAPAEYVNFASDLRHNREISASIDEADPATDLVLPILEDPDRQTRYNSLGGSVSLDRGGDELVRAQFVRGDANGNHAVDVADVVAILNGVATNCQDSIDVNDDGFADIADPIYLLDWLFQGCGSPSCPPPPAPYPDCGLDPTLDLLGACLLADDPFCP